MCINLTTNTVVCHVRAKTKRRIKSTFIQIGSLCFNFNIKVYDHLSLSSQVKHFIVSFNCAIKIPKIRSFVQLFIAHP